MTLQGRKYSYLLPTRLGASRKTSGGKDEVGNYQPWLPQIQAQCQGSGSKRKSSSQGNCRTPKMSAPNPSDHLHYLIPQSLLNNCLGVTGHHSMGPGDARSKRSPAFHLNTHRLLLTFQTQNIYPGATQSPLSSRNLANLFLLHLNLYLKRKRKMYWVI